MGATVLTVEAAVANWSGVYLHDDLGASLGVASLGYVAFIACETAGRLVGDRLFTRFPARALVGAGTLVAAGGLTVVVLSPWPSLTIAGFTVMGLGLATPLPVLFSVVGHLGADGSGAAGLLARFTTMTYSGILLGPALIGWLAQGIGLTWTLAALIPLLAVQSRVAASSLRNQPS
jgi:MFS family permease